MNTDTERKRDGVTERRGGGGSAGSPALRYALAALLGCLLFKSATARADTASYAATDGASYTSAKVYSFCPTAANDPVFNSATHVWHLGEASGSSRADPVGGTSLSETGGAVNRGTGINGFAADFNTAGHYLSSSSLLTGTNTMSVVLWVKMRSLPAALTVSYLFHIGDAFQITVLPDGVVDFRASADENDIGIALGALNAWHMLAMSFDNDVTGKWYASIDASALGSGNDIQGGGMGTYFDTVEVGLPTPLVPDGLIDEPMVFYNTALTDANITTLWASGAGLFPSP